MKLKYAILVSIVGMGLLSGCGDKPSLQVPAIKLDSLSNNTSLKCARMKNGHIIQFYNAVVRDHQLWINNKNYSNKYKITQMSLNKIAKSGIKGHYCHIVR